MSQKSTKKAKEKSTKGTEEKSIKEEPRASMSQKCAREEEDSSSSTPEVLDVTFDWLEETVSTVFFSSGQLVFKDSPYTIRLCKEALRTMGHSMDLSSQTITLRLTKEEETHYKQLYRAIVYRLHEERYVDMHLVL